MSTEKPQCFGKYDFDSAGCKSCWIRVRCCNNLAGAFQGTSSPAAVKHNKGKTPWGLILKDFKGVLEEVVKVRQYGAEKYSVDNWKGERPSDGFYTDAAIRHILSHLGGEAIDEESRRPHLAHAICTLMMELWHEQGEEDE